MKKVINILKMTQIVIVFTFASVFTVLLVSCPPPEAIINNEKPVTESAKIAKLTIAGRDVAWGEPAGELKNARARALFLEFEEASHAAIHISLDTSRASAAYSILMSRESEPVWRTSDPVNFKTGDILAIRVVTDNVLFRYYTLAVTVGKPSPIFLTEEIFRQQYLTFIDEVPQMKIYTAGGVSINSKDNYINAAINIEGSQKYNRTNWPVEIRGRGNSTWSMPKKPYRIKAKSKTSIFGLPELRNWALIANYADKSLMRNYTVHLLGRSLRMDFTANVIFVEVYINDRYDGLYCLQDQTEANKHRVDVEGYLTDGKGDLTDTGFLVELDWPDRNPGSKEGLDYVRISGLNYFITYPKYMDDEGFHELGFYQQAVAYIKDYLTQVHEAVMSQNKTAFEDLCDTDSFIDYFLVQELSKNVDGTSLSVFYNKKPGGKMKMGPLWDFDLALGNADYIPYTSDGWYNARPSPGSQTPWFQYLLKQSDFYEDFRARYIDLYDANIQYTINCIDDVREAIRPAALANFDRWRILNSSYLWPNPLPVLAIHTWDGQVDYIKDYWINRNKWMYDQLYYRQAIPGV